MSESLGEAVLTLDADSGPLNTALAVMQGDVKAQIGALATSLKTKFGSSLKAAASVGFGALAIGAGLAGKALYDLGDDFDAAYDSIAVSTGATGRKLEGLKEDFRNVVSSVPTDFESAATAISEVNKRLDLAGPPLRERAKQFLELSRITGTDLKTNIESVSKAFVDWEVPVRKQGEVLDGFFRLSQKSGISVSDLASSVQQFGSPLRQLGFTLEESASMFALFEKAGVNTETMVPGLKLALSNLSVPTDDLAGKLKKLGVDAKKPGDALKQVMKIMTDESIPAAERTGLAFDVFGKRAGADMKEAIEQGRFSLGGMLKTMENGKGTIRGSAKDTNDLSENWQIFKNKVLVGLEPIATAVFTKVNEGLIWLIKSFKGLSKGGGDAIEKIKTVLKPIVAIFSDIWEAVKVAFEGIIEAFDGALTALAGVVDLFDALIHGDFDAVWAAAQDIVKGVWKMIKGIFKTTVGAIIQILKNWGERIGNIVGNAVDALVDLAKAAWDKMISAAGTLKDKIISLIQAAWNKAKEATKTVAGDIIDFVTGLPGKIFNALKDLAGRLYDIGSNAFTKLKNGVTDIAAKVIEFVTGLPGKILKAIGDMGELLFEKGKDLVQGFIDGIKSMIDELKDVLDDLAGLVAGGSMAKPSKGGGGGLGAGAHRRLAVPAPGLARAASMMGAPIGSGPSSAGAGSIASVIPHLEAHIYVGNQEIKDITRVEIRESDRRKSGVVSAGVRPR